MSAKYEKLLIGRSILVAFVVGFGLGLPFTEVSSAQANGTGTEQPPTPTDRPATTPGGSAAVTACENDPTQDWLIGRLTKPSADDRAEIMDLIHRYHWALDDADLVQLDGLFIDQATYELCLATNEQINKSSGVANIEKYLSDYFADLDTHKSRTRHIESNTLLSSVDANTVQGKTTVVVTLQHGNIETPVLDYTASLRTEFKKERDGWKFSKLTLIPDEPKITLRAR